MNYLIVFIVTAVTDWLWAYYIKHTADGSVWKASLSSGAIVLAGAYVTTAYVEDRWAIVPAVVGAIVGTYISVRK